MADIDEQALAEQLCKMGLADEAVIEQARRFQEEQNVGLVQALITLGAVTANDIANAVREMSATAGPTAEPEGMEPAQMRADSAQRAPTAPAPRPQPPRRAATRPSRRSTSTLDAYEISPDAISAIPRAMADEYCVLPIQMSEDRILVAMPDASNVFALDAIRDHTGKRVEAIEVSEQELRKAIDHYYAAMARERIQLAAGAKDLTSSVQEHEVPTGVDVELQIGRAHV